MVINNIITLNVKWEQGVIHCECVNRESPDLALYLIAFLCRFFFFSISLPFERIYTGTEQIPLSQMPFCFSNPSQNRNTLKEKSAIRLRRSYGAIQACRRVCSPICLGNGDVNAAFLEENSHIWSLPAGNFMHVGLVGTWTLRWRVTNWL